MSETPLPRIQKWPYLVAAAILLATAGHVAVRSPSPFHTVTLLVWAGAVLVAGVFIVLPFRLEYQSLVRLTETDVIAGAVQQLQALEGVAKQVSATTAQWHGIQDHATQAQKAAREVSERMATEAKLFAESLHRANDAEKSTLRLEVEKLRRVESEWLQVVVGLLDHSFAVHQAAAQSGRADVAQQLGVFLNACRDIARRVGVTQLESKPGELFDANIHRLPQPDTAPPPNAVLEAVLAPGVGFQGRLLRPAIVLAKPPLADPPVAEPVPEQELAAVPPTPANPSEGQAPEGQLL